MLAHFDGHEGVGSFRFAPSLNDPIDLREHCIPIDGLGIEKPRQLCFLLLEQVRGREDSLAMVLERSLDLCSLFLRDSQSLHQNSAQPPSSGYVGADNSAPVLHSTCIVIGSTGAGGAEEYHLAIGQCQVTRISSERCG